MQHKGLIYAVDDLSGNLDLLSLYLKPHGYTIETYDSGETVLAQLEVNKVSQSRQPDLVLVDLMMLGLSGLAIVRQIKANRKLGYLPVIVLTAQGDSESRITGLEAGADDFLIKPINSNELLARISSLIRLKQAYDHKDWLLKQVRAANDALHTSQNKLLEAEKRTLQVTTMLTTAAGICHEMSQPLTSASLTIEFLAQGLEEGKTNDDIDILRSDILRAREILDKLRSLTRYETKPYLNDEIILDIEKSSNSLDRQDPQDFELLT